LSGNEQVKGDNTLTVENWLSLISIILVAIGGFFAWHQWRVSNRIRRAEFINRIIETLRFDKGMAEMMYMIEYEKDWYTKNMDFHDNPSGIKFKADKLLSYFEYICYLKKTKNITRKEFGVLQYDIDAACLSSDVQDYLRFLSEVSTETKHPYPNLLAYGNCRRITKP